MSFFKDVYIFYNQSGFMDQSIIFFKLKNGTFQVDQLNNFLKKQFSLTILYRNAKKFYKKPNRIDIIIALDLL